MSTVIAPTNFDYTTDEWLDNPTLDGGPYQRNQPEQIDWVDWNQREAKLINTRPDDHGYVITCISDYTEDYLGCGWIMDLNKQGSNISFILNGAKVFPINNVYVFRLRILQAESWIAVSAYDERLKKIGQIRVYLKLVREHKVPSLSMPQLYQLFGFTVIEEKG